MSTQKAQIEIYGAHRKFDIAEVRSAIARKKASPSAPANEKRHTTPTKTKGIKFPELAKKGTKPALHASITNAKRRLDLIK